MQGAVVAKWINILDVKSCKSHRLFYDGHPTLKWSCATPENPAVLPAF